MIKRTLLLIFMAISVAACSTQNRDAEPELSQEDMIDLYYEISGSVGAFSAVSPDSIVQQPDTLFWASTSSSARPAPSVLSLFDPQALFNVQFSSSFDFIEASVVFFDGFSSSNERHFGLFARVVDILDGTPYYFAGISEPNAHSFTDDDFQVSIKGPHNNGEVLILRSTDLSDEYSDELAPSVKLEIWLDNGNDVYFAGQVSTMAGYGRR